MFMERLRTKNIARTGTILVAGALVLAACVPGNVRQEYTSDPSDPCNSYREVLVESKESFTKTIAQAVIAGAAAGALFGFLKDGDAKSAMKGAVIGGLAGAAAGYFKASYDKAKTQEDLIASMQSDFAADNQRLNKAGQAVDGLTQCRTSQYETILSDFKARKVDRNAALARKADVDSKITQDLNLIDLILDGSKKRAKDFESALYAGVDLPPGNITKAQPVPGVPVKPKYAKYIALTSANVRSTPSGSGTPIGGLVEGEQVHVPVGNAGKAWQPIAWPNGKTAYVYAKLIAPRDSSAATKVLAKRGGKPKALEVEKMAATSKGGIKAFSGKSSNYKDKVIRQARARLENAVGTTQGALPSTPFFARQDRAANPTT